MLKILLKKRDFPLIVFLGLPENYLDVLTFVVLVLYLIVYYLFFPRGHLLIDVVCLTYYGTVYYIFWRFTEHRKYKISLSYAKGGLIFFVFSFLIHLFISAGFSIGWFYKRSYQMMTEWMPLKRSNFAYELFQWRQAWFLLNEFLMFPKGEFWVFFA